MNDIKRWLEDLDFGRYVEAFQANAIDIELLPDLHEADLEKIGVAALSHRKMLLRAIAELSSEPASRGVERFESKKPETWSDQFFAAAQKDAARLVGMLS